MVRSAHHFEAKQSLAPIGVPKQELGDEKENECLVQISLFVLEVV